MQRTQNLSKMTPSPHTSASAQPLPSSTERVSGLVRTHHEFVSRSVRRLGVPEAIADDVSQNVFLTAARKLEFIEPGQERAYLFGIARRVASDARRAMRRLRYAANVETAELERLGNPELSPEDLLEQKRRRELVDWVVGNLPAMERTVFVLHEFDGLAIAEIAAHLGLPEGTVASRLRRGRARFEVAIERRVARRPRPIMSLLLAPWVLLSQLKDFLQARSHLGSQSRLLSSSGISATKAGLVGPVTSLGGLANWATVAAFGATLILSPEPIQNTATQANHRQPERVAPSENLQSAHLATEATTSELAFPRAELLVRRSKAAPEVAQSSNRTRIKATPPASPRAQVAGVAEPTPTGNEVEPLSLRAQTPSLKRELAILKAVRALLAGGDTAGALDLLERYTRSAGPHALSQEAKVLRVQALAAQGAKSVARSEGAEYLKAHPTSPQAPPIQRFVEAP